MEVTGWQRFPVGMSWVTIGFSVRTAAGVQELILRLGDPEGLLSPYRTEPEFLALTTLHGTPDVPIPRVLLRCDDPSILGAPFLVSCRVAGDTPTPWGGVAGADEACVRSLGDQFSDILGALHSFDWRRTPLAAWSNGLTPENAAHRELQRWATEAGHPDVPLPPALHYGLRWLEANAPRADHIVLLHGDYRVGNFLREGDRITAILDWELVHLGDPHEDLAWAALRAFAPAGSDRVGGLVERSRFYARYAERSGITPDAHKLRYYEVLMQFKSAAMLAGASRRVLERRTRDMRMAAMGFQLAPTLMQLLRLMEVSR